jgi:hypothetical protein
VWPIQGRTSKSPPGLPGGLPDREDRGWLAGGLQILGRTLAVLAPHDVELDALAFVQAVQPGPLHGRDVHEGISPAAVRLDEPVALGGVEPLHRSGLQ